MIDYTIIYANDRTRATLTGRRLYVRRVDEESVAKRARESDTRISCEHGGTVCNGYGYPADTEAVLAVAVTPYVVVLWAHRIAANKATLCGAAGSYGDLYHGRVGAERTEATRRRLLADAERIATEHLRQVIGAARLYGQSAAVGGTP